MTTKAALAVTTILAALSSPAATHSFTNHVNAVIPDANPTGLTTTIDVQGIGNSTVEVTLSIFTTLGYNGDLFAYLASDNGGYTVLLNRVGKTAGDEFGYEDIGMSITLRDDAETDVHLYGGNAGSPISGEYQPDARDSDPQSVLDTDDRVSFFGSFNNLNPNTTWTLFIADFAGDSQSVLERWELRITAVPEPATPALLVAGGLVLAGWSRRKRSAR